MKNIYDGVENLNDFHTELELINYRKNIIRNNDALVRFLIENIRFESSDFLLDIGSGNCGFLITLDSKVDFKKGIGLEPAKTRYDFSTKWLLDENISKITTRNDLFDSNLQLDDKPSKISLLDNTFLVIAGQKNNNYEEILEDVKRNLDINGEIFLEFILIEEFKPWTKKVELIGDSRFCKTEYDMKFSADKTTIISSSKRYLKDSDDFLYKEDLLSNIDSSQIITSLSRLGFKIINTFHSLPWVSDELPRRLFIHAKLV